jgi:hypothetical protein
MNKRTPYDVQNVIASLMEILVCNGQLSLEDAKRIFKSGEYYMH